MNQKAIINEFSSVNGKRSHATEIFNHIFNEESALGITSYKVPPPWGNGECKRIVFNPSTGIGFNEIKLFRNTQLVVKSKSPLYKMMFCFGDNMEWEEKVSDTTIRLNNGEGILSRIEEAIEICPYGPNFHYKWVHTVIPTEKLDALIATLPYTPNIFQHTYRNIKTSRFQFPPESKVIIQQAASCPYEGSIKRMYLESKLMELLAVCLHALTEKNPDKTNTLLLSRSDLESLDRAKEILDNSIAGGISLSKLARLVYLNESKLKTGFKQVYGTPVYSYLLNKRMEVARILLEGQQLRVKDVAERVGYSNGNSFSKAFYKKYGYNPSDCFSSHSK